jgi:acyl-CoA thioesterase I
LCGALGAATGFARVGTASYRAAMRSMFLCLLLLLGGFRLAAAEATNVIGNVVVLGDSLAAGYGVEPEQGFVALLEEKVSEAKLPFTVVNAGVSGDTTSGGSRRIDWLLRRPISVLVLELGGNDGLRGIDPGSTRTNLQTIIDKTKARYPKAKIVVAGMEMPKNMGTEYTDEFRAVFKDVAKENGAALIPFLLEGVGGDPKLNQPDMIHPNPEGHRIVAENVWKVLKPVLEATDPTEATKQDEKQRWAREPSVR